MPAVHDRIGGERRGFPSAGLVANGDRTVPTATILALEPAFAAAFAAWILSERLDTRGWIGAGLILAGIYLVLANTGDRDALPAAEAVTPAH